MNYQSSLFSLCNKIQRGNLTVVLPSGKKKQFGNPKEKEVVLLVHKTGYFRRWFKEGTLGFGESYMDGWWDVEQDDIAGLIRIMFLNNFQKAIKRDLLLLARLGFSYLKTRNTLKQSKKNISHHYNLSNEFYSLMLDKSMTYSCGYQKKSADSLEKMQEQKYEHVCKKLQLKKGDTLVDIGCGWGGMLIYAAKKYGVKGYGCTLSKPQVEYAQEKIKKLKLEGKITVELQDYRKIKGTFDKCVSIGMFEHVGQENYNEFFSVVKKILKPGGICVLHTIGSNKLSRARGDPWFGKYIFPGSSLPRLYQMTHALDKQRFITSDVENLRNHYAVTLTHWYNNFKKNISKVSFGKRFNRMWTFYLQSCIASFYYGDNQLYQLQFIKGKEWNLPLTRSYLK